MNSLLEEQQKSQQYPAGLSYAGCFSSKTFKLTVMTKPMKLISWNINGIRAILKKDFIRIIEQTDPDILCLQETKASPEQVDLHIPGYEIFWNSAEKKGYSGTLVMTKKNPDRVISGMDDPEHDREGRVLTLEFKKFYVVNVYTPNAGRDLKRLDYRQVWDARFLSYLKELERIKPVIFCGDLNVAHKEIDLARPKQNTSNAGFTKEERKGFDNIIKAGFIDTYRHFNPDKEGMYTWWSYMFNARKKNIGWRIDYFCVSSRLKENLKKADILTDIMGSDHCPVELSLKNIQSMV